MMIEKTNQLKELLGFLCQEKSVGSPGWYEKLDHGIQLCATLDMVSGQALEKEDQTVLENVTIDLWNLSVALKARGTVPAKACTKLRHITFSVLEFACWESEKETCLKRQVMMGLKTGRACLESDLPKLAEADLGKTEKCIRRLQSLLLCSPSEETVTSVTDSRSKLKLETEQDLFAVKCSRTEACIALDRTDEAVEHMRLAKDLLAKFPKQGSFLAMLCFNIGVELTEKKKYHQAIVWLRESYELGKDKQDIGPKRQATTLRILADTYLQADPIKYLENALNAVNLANTEHSHHAGRYLMVRILLLKKAQDEVLKRALDELLKEPGLAVDLALRTLELIQGHERPALVMLMIEELLKRFENTASIGKLLITNLEILTNAEMMQQAKEFAEYCIIVHGSSQVLDFILKEKFHYITWNMAAHEFQGGSPTEALDWYNYSLSLHKQTDSTDPTLAKLHRNRAICYMELQQTEQAEVAIEESIKCDPLCPYTQFTMFKLAAKQNNSEKACVSLTKMCEFAKAEIDCDNLTTNTNGLISLAAQQAIEHDFTEAAVHALEHLSRWECNGSQVFAALRCLIRIKLTQADKDPQDQSTVEDIIGYIRTGCNKLLQLQDRGIKDTVDVQLEANWFMKIAWNVALKCEEQPVMMKDLYILCSQLLMLLPRDESTLSRQVTCLLIAAAACLQVARDSQEPETFKPVLRECLDYLKSSQEVCSSMLQQSLGVTEKQSRDRDMLMLLYEFEAKLRLQDPGLEGVMEKAIAMSESDPDLFEQLAALAMEPAQPHKNLCVRALKVAIRKHLQLPQLDITKCSQLFHSLIKLCLSGGWTEELNGKEEAWNYYTEILDVIENRAKDEYPEMEMVWLMTKAWNCGINFYSCKKYEEAEKWCALSMKLLKYLDTFKQNYQDHMCSLYTEILAKTEGNKQEIK